MAEIGGWHEEEGGEGTRKGDDWKQDRLGFATAARMNKKRATEKSSFQVLLIRLA